MGCDIHPLIRVRRDKQWQIIDHLGLSPDERVALGILSCRNYNVFAVLGNVRNGTGVAGVITGDPFVPIQSGRGFPPDFQYNDPYEDWDEENDDWEAEGYYAGDHSFGYVTLEELLDYPSWGDIRHQTGYIPALAGRDAFGREVARSAREVDRLIKSYPFEKWMVPSMSGGVDGGSTRTFESVDRMPPDEELRNGDYVRVWVKETVAQAVGAFHSVFIPVLAGICKRLDVDPRDCQIIFGFDS